MGFFGRAILFLSIFVFCLECVWSARADQTYLWKGTWLHERERTPNKDKRRQNKTRQDKARQDNARQDKTRQDQTRQDKHGRGHHGTKQTVGAPWDQTWRGHPGSKQGRGTMGLKRAGAPRCQKWPHGAYGSIIENRNRIPKSQTKSNEIENRNRKRSSDIEIEKTPAGQFTTLTPPRRPPKNMAWKSKSKNEIEADIEHRNRNPNRHRNR